MVCETVEDTEKAVAEDMNTMVKEADAVVCARDRWEALGQV
jgi:hypothetical protein